MAKNILVSWLNDAYAMEQAQIKMLNRFINDFDDYPLIQEVLTDHLEETKAQANSIKECVENMDENVSTTKSILGNMMGTLQGASTSAYEDEIVKDMIMIHAGEQFEYACYMALKSAADALGEEEIATICGEIAYQEKEVADWALDQIPILVADTISEKVEQ